jgi:hypothetical protein
MKTSSKKNYTFCYFESSFQNRVALSLESTVLIPKIKHTETWSFVKNKIIPSTQKTIFNKKLPLVLQEIKTNGYCIINRTLIKFN